MSDEEKKGFKVIDRRGVADEEREKAAEPPAPPRPPAAEEGGNRPDPAGVEGEKSPETRKSRIGGPSFLDLVMSLQMGAMLNLGLVQTGDGRRSPVDLPAAKDSIDLLDVLREKTKGNLTDEEAGALAEGLYHLRMAYVEAVQAGISAPNAGPGRKGTEP